MTSYIRVACFVVSTLILAHLVSGSVSASHAEGKDFEPFDPKSVSNGTIVGNVGSPCGGYTGANGVGDNFVRAVQLLLYADNLYGGNFTKYPGPIDGLFGPNTENGLRDWQTGHGLTSDGCFGHNSANHSQGGAGDGNHITPNPDGFFRSWTYVGKDHSTNSPPVRNVTYQTAQNATYFDQFIERSNVGGNLFDTFYCFKNYSFCTVN